MIFKERPAVIGHRGAGSGRITDPVRGVVTENTIESMLAALEAGASWVEIDVQRTRDDALVLRHDPTTAGGEFLVERTKAQAGLPELAEIFEALPPEAGVNLDVKTVLEDAVYPAGRRTGTLLAPALAAEAERRPLLVTSFDPALLVQIRQQVPSVPVGLLTWMTFPAGHAISAAAGLGLQAVALHTGSLRLPDPDGTHRGWQRPAAHPVEVAHRAGLDVLVWCPRPEEVPGFAAAGVDAVIVNDVPGTVAALATQS